MSLHFNSDYSCLFENEKEIYKFKSSNKTNKFLSQFCQGSIPNKFDYVDSKKYLLKETCMIFQLIMMLLINLTF